MTKKDPFSQTKDRSLSIKRIGTKHNLLNDFYHQIMRYNWPQFIFLFIGSYLVINLCFACLYYIGGDSILNARPDSLWDSFLFSFQTSSTIGYGQFLPKSFYAHIIVLFDAISGIMFVAIATGLAFAKFSKPTARVMFSKNLLVTNFDGNRVLMFRMGNSRRSQLLDANVRVSFSKPEVTLEGEFIRRIYDLELVRSHTPLFGLSWQVMHILDESSSLTKILSGSDSKLEELSFIVSTSGVDDVFSQGVYDRHVYWGRDIVFDRYFTDIMGVNDSGEAFIDYNKFHSLKDLS